jgi:ferrous iron transport protein A
LNSESLNLGLIFLDYRDVFTGAIIYMKKIIKMREMSDNQKGIIHKITTIGEMGRRIREMGLVAGTDIMIQGRAPLRDPVAVKVRDFTLTLRNNEADQILVEVEDSVQK